MGVGERLGCQRKGRSCSYRSNRLKTCGREYKYMILGIIRLKLKVGIETWVIICICGPADDRDLHTKEKYFEEVNECILGFRNERMI